jgi:hypothetical protein
VIFRLIGSRLLAAIVTMGVAAVVIYGSLRLIPGDPVSAITAGTRLTSEQRAALREKLGLNQDFVSGFTHWLGSVLQLDFGQSMVYGEGWNYPDMDSFSSGLLTGMMPVGIRTWGDTDEPWWPQVNNACYKEVWVTVAGKFLSLIAEL